MQKVVADPAVLLHVKPAHGLYRRYPTDVPPVAPSVMNVDRGDLARQLRRLQQADLHRGNPTDRRWH